MCSGYINIDYGELRNISSYGYAWLSTASFKHDSGFVIFSAYHFVFNDAGVDPLHGPDYRKLGFPLRA